MQYEGEICNNVCIYVNKKDEIIGDVIIIQVVGVDL